MSTATWLVVYGRLGTARPPAGLASFASYGYDAVVGRRGVRWPLQQMAGDLEVRPRFASTIRRGKCWSAGAALTAANPDPDGAWLYQIGTADRFALRRFKQHVPAGRSDRADDAMSSLTCTMRNGSELNGLGHINLDRWSASEIEALPARCETPWRMAFSTMGCKIRLGTRASSVSGSIVISTVSRSWKRTRSISR